VSTVLTQRLVTLNERAIGQRYSLQVTIILLVDEPIHLGNRPIGLAALAPLNLNGPALTSRQSSSARSQGVSVILNTSFGLGSWDRRIVPHAGAPAGPVACRASRAEQALYAPINRRANG